MDVFYTPTCVAEAMVKYARCRNANPTIADFSVGDGELLRAAVVRWPKATLVGSDISRSIIDQLLKKQPSWFLSKCNFLNFQSRQQSSALQKVKGKVSLVLLNPPFSNRGARRLSVVLKDADIKCSQGLAFVITAISYLTPRGEIVAVLPAGTLHSQLDADAWQLIHRFCEHQILARNGYKTFRGCSPKTIIVRLKLRRKPKVSAQIINRPPTKRLSIFVTLERGKVDMTSLNDDYNCQSIPLVHTTELNSNKVNLKERRVIPVQATLSQEAVLLPRVGRPSRAKVCLHLETFPVALSSCVIAIKCRNKRDAKIVYNNLLYNWGALEENYGGTCAPYLTLDRLRLLLIRFGFQIDQSNRVT